MSQTGGTATMRQPPSTSTEPKMLIIVNRFLSIHHASTPVAGKAS